MTIDEIKRGLRCCTSEEDICEECPYYSDVSCVPSLKKDVREYIDTLERLSTPETGKGIDPEEFLNRLHEWQAHAVINELTESKAVFDISIAIVEDMVKEMNPDEV